MIRKVDVYWKKQKFYYNLLIVIQTKSKFEITQNSKLTRNTTPVVRFCFP